MTEFWKTISFVGVALVLTGAAFVSTRDRTSLNDTFNDQGKPFFPEFKDPLACTDLEVVDFEPSTATATRFRVMFNDKKWVIPSHHNYPADARDRLSKTAAAVMDLVKDTIRSDGLEDTQERMGVVDPLDSKVGTLKGRGKRVTLRDASERVLADFIIGNEIKGNERKEGSGGQRYVRVPGQKRIYGVNVKADLSTRFADWIETNLLKVDATKVRRIVFDNYKLQEAGDGRGMVLQRGEKLTIERKDSSGPWTMEGLPADQELSDEKLRALTDALGDLKIVGVRPKPPGLKDPNQPEMKLTMPIVASLASKGFILAKQGLFSDQGDVIVTTDEGVVYTLRYGGPVFGTGEELTAGQADDVEKQGEEAKKGAAKKSEGTQENRYLMVTVSFDPALIPKPKSLEPKPKPAIKTDALVNIPSNAFAPNPNDPKYIAEQKEAEEKAKQDQVDYDKKIAEGEKRVKELVDRFGPWYYVTTGDSFRAINLDRTMLVQPKKAAGTPPGDGPAGVPGPLPPGLPGGFAPRPR
jgi:Domain of unknown function (DUF4340)